MFKSVGKFQSGLRDGRNIPGPISVGFTPFSFFCVLQSCQFLFRFRAVLFSCLVSAFVRNSLYSTK